MQTGKQIREIADFGDVLSLSPDGKRLLVGTQRGVFTLWDTATGERLSSDATVHSHAPSLHLSAKGDRAITVGHTTISDWDVKSGRRLQSFEVPRVTSANRSRAISPDGRRALTASKVLDQSFLHVWDLEAHRELRKMSIDGEFPATTFAFSPDSKRFALLRPGDPRATVTVYEVDSGKEVSSFVDPNKRWSSDLFFTDGGKTIIVVSKRIAGFSVADGKMLFNYRVEPADAAPSKDPGVGVGVEKQETTGWQTGVFTANGDLAACVLKGPAAGFGSTPVINRLALLDGRTGKVIRRWPDGGKATQARLAFSPDGKLLATSDGHDIHVWETATGKELRTFRGHRNEIETLAFSADGRRLASGGGDSTVLVWGLSPLMRSEPSAWWKELLSQDVAVAYAAAWQLADATDDVAMPILKKNLQPATYADQRRILEAIADLDSDQFRVREGAFKDLIEIGIAARSELERAADRRPSAEKATRIERLLAKCVGPPAEGEALRTWRAFGVLETRGTPGARALLKELAAGVPDAWLTREATAALRRIEK
jgi:WD40 repeat protein